MGLGQAIGTSHSSAFSLPLTFSLLSLFSLLIMKSDTLSNPTLTRDALLSSSRTALASVTSSFLPVPLPITLSGAGHHQRHRGTRENEEYEQKMQEERIHLEQKLQDLPLRQPHDLTRHPKSSKRSHRRNNDTISLSLLHGPPGISTPIPRPYQTIHIPEALRAPGSRRTSISVGQNVLTLEIRIVDWDAKEVRC